MLGWQTRLLREAKAAGAVPVSGLEMFVGQAAAQFTLFTGAWHSLLPWASVGWFGSRGKLRRRSAGKEAPVELMREAVLSSL